MGIVFVVIFIFIIAIAVIIYGFYAEAKRRAAMMQIAQQIGLNYLSRQSSNENAIYQDISLFQQGHSHSAYNIIGGRLEDCEIGIFDYKYVTGSGKSEETHVNSVCVLTIPQRFQYLFIRPETFLDKIAGMLGFDDINFENKEFSRRYYVKSADRKFAYDVINPQMMEFLLGYPKPPIMEINNRHLAFYFHRRITPTEYIGLYNLAREFYRKIPHYVLEENT